MSKANVPELTLRCDHVPHNGLQPGMFCKRKIWVVDQSFPFRHPEFQRVDLVQPCKICNQLYRYWRDYADMCRISSTLGSTVEAGSDSQYPDGSTILSGILKHQDNTLKTDLIALESSNGKTYTNPIFTVQLKRRQYGEAYHVLICRILCWGLPGSMVGVTFEESRTPEQVLEIQQIKDLFRWYRVMPENDLSRGAHAVGKGKATEMIADAFRAANNRKRNKARTRLNQPRLFRLLRRQLNTDAWPYKEAEDPENVDIDAKYFWPTYAAKYWLNRYLRLTEQSGLPKRADVGRLAVIHIRRGGDALTAVGRVMDDENLKEMARSIRIANKVSDQARRIVLRSQRRVVDGKAEIGDLFMYRFTHIVLYGDFDYSEAFKLKSLVEKEVDDSNVRVIFISRAWKSSSASEAHTGRSGEVDRFWEKFRDFDFDHVPIQVKILGVWTTLCERYHPRLCVIGHRSGFIEGAALIGIPVFYLNNERSKIRGEHGPGDLLWQRVESPEGDRLRELADVMNTFIPIEALQREPDKLTKTLRVDKRYRHELAAALFMYMCSDLGVGELELNARNKMSTAENPGWIARVDMMHNTCAAEGHTPGPECDDDALFDNDIYGSNGQEWLRRRYEFAVNVAEGVDQPRVRFSRWTGRGVGRWVSQPEVAGDPGRTTRLQDREWWSDEEDE